MFRSPWAAETRATLALGGPLVLTNLAQVAIGTTDTLLLGWLGPQALAAGALGINLYWGLFVIGVGLVTAIQPLLAQTLGRRRSSVRVVRRITRQGLWLALGYTGLAWLVLWHADSLLRALGQDPELSDQAQLYIYALMPGLLPALVFQTLRGFIAALERPRAALVVTAAAIGLNAFLGWSLIFGHAGMPALGLVGAGLASTLSNTAMALALLVFVLVERRLRRYHLMGRFWRLDSGNLRELLRVGIPLSLSMGFEMVGLNAAAFLCGLLGAPALAAHAIALQVSALTFMVPMGFAQAATVRVGLAAGAGNLDGVRRAGWVAFVLGVGFMSAMAVVLLTQAPLVATVFLDRADPASVAVLPLAASLLMIAGVFQIADGAQVVAGGALRGLKDTRVPMLVVGFGYWALAVPLGATLAFAAGLGPQGVWWGLALGLILVAVLLTLRWANHPRLLAGMETAAVPAE
ncbi:MATE family efflux transporter [Pararhodospirillum oryzae]|uniref:Multidrug-efflux transporter n=1 Tax=Pararhodospirillum oryzae TaxID=478448 RepID=A0A512H6D6_9PROT|nr:MATE family efflux transporter [Pararhodospirillum oryzae]GEO80988.1 MATE family efflux transporter [Pararhodospirillum oryzae]